MAIDVATGKKVASLSRLREGDERLQALAGELNGILGWIEQLNEVDVTGVEPMTTAVEQPTPMRRRRSTVSSSCRRWSNKMSLTKLTLKGALDGMEARDFTSAELTDAFI